MTQSKEFQIFVKPVGALCNLKCSYCYYLNSNKIVTQPPLFKMSDEIVEKYIVQHLKISEEDVIFFSWHGGEPTLAGVGFFEKAVEIQKKYKKKHQKIINGIQTNGTLLNEKWIEFLAKENFFVGISIDGPEHFHNQNRLNQSGQGTFTATIESYKKLKSFNIHTEILCVVNAKNVYHAAEVYRFFKDLGAEYLSFLPLVDRDPHIKNAATNDSVPAKAFGEFMIEIFDEWLENDIGNIKIQIFEEALRSAFKQDHTLCIFKKECGRVPVLEKNGNFYSCDHFVNESHLIGNLNNQNLFELIENPKQKQFGEIKFNSLPDYCLQCNVLDMCNGECPKNRFILSPDGEPGLNYLCEGYQLFFKHCKPFIATITSVWEKLS